jgi:hypothetical protein
MFFQKRATHRVAPTRSCITSMSATWHEACPAFFSPEGFSNPRLSLPLIPRCDQTGNFIVAAGLTVKTQIPLYKRGTFRKSRSLPPYIKGGREDFHPQEQPTQWS